MRSMTVFNYLLEATLMGSILILLVTAVRLLLRDRLGSRAIYAAWLLVALRLLLPITLPNPAMDELRPGFSVDVEARPVADQVRQRVIDTGHNVSALLGRGDDSAIRRFTVHTSKGETGRWILLGWGVIGIGVGGWLFWRMERFQDRVQRNRVRPLNDEEETLYRELCQRYRVKPVPVYYVDRLPAGCTVGVVRPFIGLPLHTPRGHLALVLAHQLCHLRARSTWWGVVRCLCCAIHWFNPLVWMAAWLSWRDSEMACDDRVTAKLHDMDRLAYANVIVSAGERSGDAMISADAVGASFTDKHIRQRVSSVIRCVRGSRWGLALSALAAAVVLVISFATSESEPLPTIGQVPVVAWSASAVPIGGDMEAIACARRFLESEFVGEDTARLSFTARTDGRVWQLEARQAPEDEPILLLFSHDGYLLEYDGMIALENVTFTDTSYTHSMFTESVESYIAAFMTALVPGRSWESGRVTADLRAGEIRLLCGMLRDAAGEPVCEFALQVEPEVRLLHCATFAAPESNG